MKLTDNDQAKDYGKTVYGYNYIDGQEVEASNNKRFNSTNPSYNKDLVGSFPLSTEEDVENACIAAKNAFKEWKNTPAPIRGGIIANIGDLLTKNKDVLAKIITREIGKTPKEAMGSVQEAIDTAHFFQSEGRRLYGQTVPSEMRNKELYTYRRPIGVTGVITAGNFPLAVPSWKIIPALLCGNTIVWKPSDDAAAVGYLFGKILEDAGVPKGVVNIIHGTGAEAGDALVKMVDKGYLQKFSFTGSTAVGRHIGEVCGRNLLVPSLELGGKNPLIVMEDADLDLAVHGAVWSSFGTAGQRCTSAGNIILHKDIAQTFKAKFLEAVKKIKIGNPLLGEVLYGPMLAERFLNTFMKHYEIGKADGATLLYGNGQITKENKPEGFVGDPESGLYAWPVIWDNVKIDMRIAQEEIFGPVITLLEVNNIEEAMEVANGTPYGLSSAIYTNNPDYMYKFKNEIGAGMSSINNSTTGAEAHLPFGGNGASGNNTRESGIWVIDSYTRWHAVNVDLSGKLQLAQMDTQYVEEKTLTDFSTLLASK
ncbi:MAG: aldehyde dehydrogenase family protein [Candidatus Sericytochromatia bacterium]|nr:aldehyde dehydrogenase family protein [Candidatus Sericytochromatia bacterium]